MPFQRPIPESKPPTQGSSALRGYVEAEKLIQLAFVLPGAVVVGWGAGWWADQRLHQHWVAIAGIVFGSIAGLFYVIQQAVASEKKSRKEEPIQNGTGEGSADKQL
ncbi:MAG: AtpZ/AtpI family protein [Terracidiphilus sp.]|jgi:F0F1-type ATP synthase assembly protein I